MSQVSQKKKPQQNKKRGEIGRDIICRYLKESGIEFSLGKTLWISNRLLGCEFLLEGGDVIKYWATGSITEVTQKPEHAKVYQRYVDAWLAFRQDHKGRIYEIRIDN